MSKYKKRDRSKKNQSQLTRWLVIAGVTAILLTIGQWLILSNKQGGNGNARAISRLSTNDFHSLAFSATEPDTVFFGHHNGLLVSHNGGKDWQPVSGFNADAMALAIPSSPPHIIYAAGHGVFSKSTDDGKTWVSPVTNLPGSDIHGFIADPDNANLVYANVVGFGIFGSQDGGTTWSQLPTTGSPNIMVMSMAIGQDSQTLYLPGGEGGLWRSPDGGKSWAKVEKIPDAGAVAALYVRANSRLYLTTSGSAAGLYYSDDGGKVWASMGLNGIFLAVAVSPLDPKHIIVVSNQGEVFASRDNGVSWTGQ